MVQEGFLDMGQRFNRVDERLEALEIDVGQLKVDVGQLKVDMAEVKGELPKFATVGMHAQLAGRVCTIEDHLGI